MHITKQFKFEAAHVLPNHRGQCARLHGHSYVVEVCVSGELEVQIAPDQGMVVDFSGLTTIWKLRCEPRLDHQFLNDTLPVDVTTAEVIACWIWEQFTDDLADVKDDIGVEVEYVRVWETTTSSAIATGPVPNRLRLAPRQS